MECPISTGTQKILFSYSADTQQSRISPTILIIPAMRCTNDLYSAQQFGYFDPHIVP